MRILFTTVIRPFSVENETTTKEINYEALVSNFGKGQANWVPRGLIKEPSTHFIASNLEAYCVVLDHPSMDELLKELKKGYDILAISFITPYYPKLKHMIEKLRKHYPEQTIVIGGYGVKTPGVEKLEVDYVCKKEGIQFFSDTFGIKKKDMQNPVVKCHKNLRFAGFLPTEIFLNPFYLATGLGCSYGCEFCATSHFWGQRFLPLSDAKKIHSDMDKIEKSSHFKPLYMVNQDDFLSSTKRNREIMELNRKNNNVFNIFCFSSIASITQYTYEELLELGADVIFIGIETQYPDDGKGITFNAKKQVSKQNTKIHELVKGLGEHGISTVGAFILNVPAHTKKTLKSDIEYAHSFDVSASQFSCMTPYPGTPFFDRIDKEGRLIYDYKKKDFDENSWKYYDGMTLVYKKEYSQEYAKKMLLYAFKKEFELKGPTVLRMLKNQFSGYLKYKNSQNKLLRKRAKMWKKRLSMCIPIVYAAANYSGLKLTPHIQQEMKGFLNELQKKIRRINLGDKILARYESNRMDNKDGTLR